jgi:hypothetical protein
VLLADFNQALLLRDQARVSGDRELVQQAIALLGKVHGVQLEFLPADHIDTLNTLLELATSHFRAGNTNEGVRLILEAHTASNRKDGPDHPMTQQVRARIQEMHELTKRPELNLAPQPAWPSR